jgi:hypothetical protein
MARAYPEGQPGSPTPIEVVWQRRPRARQIPVRFVTAPPRPVEPPRASATELAWRPRLETDGKSHKD